MNQKNSEIVVALLIVFSIIVLYSLYYLNGVSVIIRAALAIALLIAVGSFIKKFLSFSGGYGFYMMGSKKGLSTIDRISKKYRTFWEIMAVWGLTLGFGLLTYPLVKGKIDKRVYAFGVISIILILVFVLPYIANSFSFINLPKLQNAVAASSSSSSSSTSQVQSAYLLSYASYGISVIAGFSGSILLSLFINTEKILYSIILYLTTPSLGAAGSGIASQIPGVAPVIPGIDIPLFAGIIALALLLIVHEFSHGILSRISKVKLKSIGLLVFGFIPIGGYVEPDEKQISKLNSTSQTNIFAAGIGANFVAMMFFFVLVVVFTIFILPGAYPYKVVVTQTLPNYPANNVLRNGMQILKWNNISIKNISSLTAAAASDHPNGTVTVVTNNGTYAFKAVASPSNSSKGIIGVSLGYEAVITTPYAKVIYFLFTVFSLSLLLNFLVAVVNLLPIPGFDGYRIYTTNIKRRLLVNTLGAFIILMIVINALPWIL